MTIITWSDGRRLKQTGRRSWEQTSPEMVKMTNSLEKGDLVVTYRLLTIADRPAFISHMVGLDKQARHSRFEAGMSDQSVADYAADCFGPGDRLVGAYRG